MTSGRKNPKNRFSLHFDPIVTFCVRIGVENKSFLTICFLEEPLSVSQPAFTCSKLTIETLEQDVKYFQS